MYKIYTDGAASNNGYENSIGGWAFLILDDNEKIIDGWQGKVDGATNNQMELEAIIQAFNFLQFHPIIKEDFYCEVYTDSA